EQGGRGDEQTGHEREPGPACPTERGPGVTRRLGSHHSPLSMVVGPGSRGPRRPLVRAPRCTTARAPPGQRAWRSAPARPVAVVGLNVGPADKFVKGFLDLFGAGARNAHRLTHEIGSAAW